MSTLLLGLPDIPETTSSFVNLSLKLEPSNPGNILVNLVCNLPKTTTCLPWLGSQNYTILQMLSTLPLWVLEIDCSGFRERVERDNRWSGVKSRGMDGSCTTAPSASKQRGSSVLFPNVVFCVLRPLSGRSKVF